MLGDTLFDTFFTISALIDFYKLNKLYQQKDGVFSVFDILKMYTRMFLRFLPTAYMVFFFGVYVIPNIYGVPNGESSPGPLWYTFKEILFF